MLQPTDLEKIQNSYSSAQTFLILLRSQPTFDQVAAALALHLCLQYQKKEVHTVCEAPMLVEFGNIVAVDQVKSELGNRSLKITFPYEETAVEHVGYDIDQESKQFHLIVRPKKGNRPLDPTAVEYSNVGLDADQIFMFGIGSYEDIKTYYETEEQAFHQAHTVALNKHEVVFANTNVDVSGHSSFCEAVHQIIHQLKLPVNSDISTNLLAGIEQATEGFHHYSVTADTFEIVAQLMRQGARRFRVAQASQSQTSDTSNLAQAFANQKKKAQENAGEATPPAPPTPGSLNFTPSMTR